MNEADLVAEAVPWIADILAEAAGHAHDDWRGEAVRGPPAQRSTIVQLLRRRIRVLTELNLCDGHQSTDRHTHGAADDPLFGEAGVENATLAELSLEALGHEVHAAFAADVLPE